MYHHPAGFRIYRVLFSCSASSPPPPTPRLQFCAGRLAAPPPPAFLFCINEPCFCSLPNVCFFRSFHESWMALRLAWIEDKAARHLEGACHRRRRQRQRAPCTGRPEHGLSTPGGEWGAVLCVRWRTCFRSCDCRSVSRDSVFRSGLISGGVAEFVSWPFVAQERSKRWKQLLL